MTDTLRDALAMLAGLAIDEDRAAGTASWLRKAHPEWWASTPLAELLAPMADAYDAERIAEANRRIDNLLAERGSP